MINKAYKKVVIIVMLFLIQLNAASAQGVMLINTDFIEGDDTYIFDGDDSGGDIKLQFGQSLGEYLEWNDTDNAFKFSDDLDLENNQLLNARIENAAIAPTCDGTVNGKIYHNTADTNSYVCNGTSWVQIDGGGGAAVGDLATVQARNSAGFTLPDTNWYDITFGNTDVETDASVIEHNNTNTERIDIKEDGVYLVTYQVDAVATGNTHTIQAQILINGTTILPGSTQEGYNYQNEHSPTTGSYVAELNNGDYLTLNVRRLTVNTIIEEPTITVTKLDGVVGPQGPPGIVGNGTDFETFILDQDDTGGDVSLQFGTTLNKKLTWDATSGIFSTNNEQLSFRTQQSSTAPATCNSTVAGMQWMDTDTGIIYVCDTSNGRNKWLSITEVALWGDESGTCPAGSDPNSNANCNVDWGNGLGPNSNSALGIYVPFPATITGYGYSEDDGNCTSGSFDVEVWSTTGPGDDNNYSLDAEVATGLTLQAYNANDLNIDIDGGDYILWGIDNNCDQGIDDFNIVFYLKWRQ